MNSLYSERRAHPRYPLGATLLFTYTGQRYAGNVNDLGKGGLSFWAEVDMPIGESLTLTITLIVGAAQAKLTSRGTIRWKQSGEAGLVRYGAAFDQLNAAQLAILAEFLGGTGEPPVRDPR
jgi:hypothetical protein